MTEMAKPGETQSQEVGIKNSVSMCIETPHGKGILTVIYECSARERSGVGVWAGVYGRRTRISPREIV